MLKLRLRRRVQLDVPTVCCLVHIVACTAASIEDSLCKDAWLYSVLYCKAWREPARWDPLEYYVVEDYGQRRVFFSLGTVMYCAVRGRCKRTLKAPSWYLQGHLLKMDIQTL